MPWVNLHAVALSALPLVTGIACLLTPRRRPNSHQVTMTTLIAGGAVFVVHGLNSHLCSAGNPAMQCVIIGACIWIVLAYMKSKSVRVCIAVVMIGIMMLLSMHYVDLVHGRKWVGNVQHRAGVGKAMEDRLAHIRDNVQQVGINDEMVYPEGWLRSLPIGTDLEDVIGDDLPYRVESHRVWHTWFTRLFRVHEVSQDFWYPGGRPSDAAANIVLKDAS